MRKEIDQYREWWQYLSQNQKDLILEGQFLMYDVLEHHNDGFKDYSFVIFPFAKAYEGFLKQLFKDLKYISRLDYISDHIRLGKLLSPHLVDKLGDRSLYQKICQNNSEELAQRIWQTWKTGRNQVFHYFPHNLKAVSFIEAEKVVDEIIETMEETYAQLKTEKLEEKAENTNL